MPAAGGELLLLGDGGVRRAREGRFSDVFEFCCVSVTLGDRLVGNQFRWLRMNVFWVVSNCVVVVMISLFRGSVLFCGLGWGPVGWEA